MDLGHHVKPREATTSGPRSKKKGMEKKGVEKTGVEKTGVDESMTAYNHVRVYVAADKFGIPSLKVLAAKRFGEWCERNWESKDFHHVLERSMAMIPLHDTSFQENIAGALADNIVKLVRNGAISQFVESHGKIGWAIISNLVYRCDVWEPAWDRIAAKITNDALERSICHVCDNSAGELRVHLGPGDFKNQIYRCIECGFVFECH